MADALGSKGTRKKGGSWRSHYQPLSEWWSTSCSIRRNHPVPNPAPTSSTSNIPIGTRSWTADVEVSAGREGSFIFLKYMNKNIRWTFHFFKFTFYVHQQTLLNCSNWFVFRLSTNLVSVELWKLRSHYKEYDFSTRELDFII